MKFVALRDIREEAGSRQIEHLFNVNGALRKIYIVSGYVDIPSLEAIVRFLKKFQDQRCYPELVIVCDLHSSHYFTDQRMTEAFDKLARKIRGFCTEESGLYLARLGCLCHSKAYVVESTHRGRVQVGSMNLTGMGLAKNEEILLDSLEYDVKGSTADARVAKKVVEYISSLLPESEKVGECEVRTSEAASSLRELLLGGYLFYESKELNAFRFKLDLPSELLLGESPVDEMLDSKTTDSVDIKSFFKGLAGVDTSAERGASPGRNIWKPYCVETCYGFWCPACFKEDLQARLAEVSCEKGAEVDALVRQVHAGREHARQACMTLIRRIGDNPAIPSHALAGWDLLDAARADKKWEKWYDTLQKKLGNAAYVERLKNVVRRVPVPDVWSEPLAAEEFETSFHESLLYYQSKTHGKNQVCNTLKYCDVTVPEDFAEFFGMAPKIAECLAYAGEE